MNSIRCFLGLAIVSLGRSLWESLCWPSTRSLCLEHWPTCPLSISLAQGVYGMLASRCSLPFKTCLLCRNPCYPNDNKQPFLFTDWNFLRCHEPAKGELAKHHRLPQWQNRMHHRRYLLFLIRAKVWLFIFYHRSERMALFSWEDRRLRDEFLVWL